MIIAHLSDIHFGRIADPNIVHAIVEEVNDRKVDLVVVSGDLTQRARPEQFQEAAAMLASFEARVLVVPGNHDVFAWWHRPILRLFDPLRRYEQLISNNLLPSFEYEDVAVLGINSAYGWTIKGGRIETKTLEHVRNYFEEKSEDTFKVLVVHHHLTKIAALGKHDIARNAQRALDVAAKVGVDMVLCGHLHISHIEPVEIIPGPHRMVVVSAGTATSNRGRGDHRQTNFYNLIYIASEEVVVEERRYIPEAKAFIEECSTSFSRVLSL